LPGSYGPQPKDRDEEVPEEPEKTLRKKQEKWEFDQRKVGFHQFNRENG
jgi:hypothetical protein